MPAAANITDTHPTTDEIVLSERVVSKEFKILEIREQIFEKRVQVEVELGPFITRERPDGSTEVFGTSRRGLLVWQGDEYDAIRDHWSNADLLPAVIAKLAV